MAAGRILLLDANRERLASRTKGLSRNGYQITAVDRVEKALEAISEQTFELLVLRADAPQLLNMLLAQFPADIAVVVVTRPAEMESIVESAGPGLHEFLVEPVSIGRLSEAIAATLNARQSLMECVRNQALSILGQARGMLTPGIDLGKYLSIVAEMSAVGTDADYAEVSVTDVSGSGKAVNAYHGDAGQDWRDLRAGIPSGDQPIVIAAEPETAGALACKLSDAGISAILCTPLTIKSRVAGTIHLVRRQPKKPFTGADVNFAAVLSWWTGVAIDNLRLFHTVEQQGRHVEELLQEVSHAQENERKRVAIEIHDGVAQWMVGARGTINRCVNS